jgi:hypothetical protein
MKTPTGIRLLAGIVDYWSKDVRKYYPWSTAMNGQTSRLEAARRIIYELGIERIVETGTYRGTTTEWFGQFGIAVETVEIHPRYFAFARARLRGLRTVTVTLGTSVTFLEGDVALGRSKDLAHLFYLDAHWGQYLPLRQELEIIFQNYTNATVLIDDFKVPDDNGYGFDSYGADMTLDLAHISAANLPKLRVFFPSAPSSQETGIKRGWVVLTSNNASAQKLSTIQQIKEFISSENVCNLEARA